MTQKQTLILKYYCKFQIPDDSVSSTNETDPTKTFIIPTNAIDSTQDFFNWYNDIEVQLHNGTDDVYRQYFEQLASRRSECDHLLDKINSALDSLDGLKTEYNFVSNKTYSLNSGSEKLIAEQNKLIEITDEIKRRLHYFTQAENLLQILQSPTISVSSEIFEQTLTRVDECIAYIKNNVSKTNWWHMDDNLLVLIRRFFWFFRVNSKIRPPIWQSTINVWRKQCS